MTWGRRVLRDQLYTQTSDSWMIRLLATKLDQLALIP